MQTLKDRDPQEFAALVGIYNLALEQINAPDYERVAPPLKIKRRALLFMPGALKCSA